MALWPGIYDGAPPFVSASPTIEIAGVESITFCFWWANAAWRRGPIEFPASVHEDPDGSEYLLKPIANTEEATEFLTSYYSQPVGKHLVAALFAGQPIDARLLTELAVEADAKDLAAEAAAIGYPVQSR